MKVVVVAALALAATGFVVDEAQPNSRALVACKSDKSFQETVDGLIAAINADDTVSLFDTVDFAAEAMADGESIDPNSLIVFGNPALGAPVMLANRAVSAELPKKFNVFETAEGVYVTYNPSVYMAFRFGDLDDVSNVLDEIDDLYESLVLSVVPSCEKITGGKKKLGRVFGLTTTESANDFNTTFSRVEMRINSDMTNVKMFFTVDHEANDPLGELPPVKLAVFGNVGAVGVPLINANPAVVLDLPLKVLVWQDEESGKTFVTVNDMSYVKLRHRLKKTGPNIRTANAAIMDIVTFATTAP